MVLPDSSVPYLYHPPQQQNHTVSDPVLSFTLTINHTIPRRCIQRERDNIYHPPPHSFSPLCGDTILMKTQHTRTHEQLTTMLLLFFTVSVSGYLWEILLYFFLDGSFINRGFFHGPWLPIYG
ncbi:MAG: putative ABC transporter permease, partial [Lachnospiraceae bacterium]|nr:putative ABC transporter permease [Lachnospiraceae bacterium]